MRSKLASILVIAAIVLVPAGLAAPASAATLPPGDTLWALSCVTPGPDPSELYRINPADASATLITTDEGSADECPHSTAHNPVNDINYYLAPIAEGGWSLNTIDTANGKRTVIAPLTGYAAGKSPDSFTVDMFGDGYLTILGNFVSVDLVTGVTTHLAASEQILAIYAMAADPRNGRVYAIDATLRTFWMNAPGGIRLLNSILDDSQPEGIALQIDKEGAWWVLEGGEHAELFTGEAPLTEDQTFDYVGVLTHVTDRLYSRALLITPGLDEALPPSGGGRPEIAATGVDSSGAVATGLAGGGILLVGACLLAARRRRTNADGPR